MSTKKEQDKESAELQYLDPGTLKISRSDGGFLSLRIGRKKYPRVHLYRAFPLSSDDTFVSVRDVDDKEIGMILSLEPFGSQDRALIEEELSARYFAPLVESIVSLKEEFGYTYWEAETSAGRCRFTVRIGRGAVLQLEDGSLLLSDVDGNRFELADYHSLESKHQRIVEMLL